MFAFVACGPLRHAPFGRAQQLRPINQPMVNLDDLGAHARVELDLAAVAEQYRADHVARRHEHRARLPLAVHRRLHHILRVVRAVVDRLDFRRRLEHRMRRRDAEDANSIRVHVQALVVARRVRLIISLRHGRVVRPSVGAHEWRRLVAVDVAAAVVAAVGIYSAAAGRSGRGGRRFVVFGRCFAERFRRAGVHVHVGSTCPARRSALARLLSPENNNPAMTCHCPHRRRKTRPDAPPCSPTPRPPLTPRAHRACTRAARPARPAASSNSPRPAA